MNRRWGTVGVTSLLVVFLLSGCSAPVQGAVGLTIIGDRAYALVRSCNGAEAQEIRMIRAGRHLPLGPELKWTFGPAVAADVELGRVADLREAMGDDGQTLAVSGPNGSQFELRFSPLDLDRIGLNEVLTTGLSQGDGSVLSVDQFEDAAEDLC